jgi:predicted GNAT family N-acyltransferase
MHILKFTIDNKVAFEKALNIRKKVFIEEQNVNSIHERDGKDPVCIHYLLFDKDMAIGTARRRETEEGLKLERLAVIKAYRGLGYANELMLFILKDILPTKKKVYLHAQAGVEDIYKKYGFKIVGEKFFEAEIEHYKMEYFPD